MASLFSSSKNFGGLLRLMCVMLSKLFFTLAPSLKSLIKHSLLLYQKFLTQKRFLILGQSVYAMCSTKLFQRSLLIDQTLLWIALSLLTKIHSSRVGIFLITSSWHMKLLRWLGKIREGKIGWSYEN